MASGGYKKSKKQRVMARGKINSGGSRNQKINFFAWPLTDMTNNYNFFEKSRVVFLNDLNMDGFSEEDTYGVLTSKTAERVYREILHLYLQDKKKPIYLFIVNNVGGDFYGMLSIYELIESIKKTTPVYTIVSGYAYSAAAFLFLAGSKRYITPHSRIMFHYGTTEIHGDPQTTKKWFLESERVLRLQEQMLLKCYKPDLKDESQKLSEIKNILTTDTIYDGIEAVELGFATDFFTAKSGKNQQIL